MDMHKAQIGFAIFLQVSGLLLAILGHGHEMWKLKGKDEPLGGLWVTCTDHEDLDSCEDIEEDHVTDGDWTQLNAARACFLACNLLSLVELVVLILILIRVALKEPLVKLIVHLIVSGLQFLALAAGAGLSTELWHDDQYEMGWSLICSWIGFMFFAGVIIMPVGVCTIGEPLDDDEDKGAGRVSVKEQQEMF